MIIQINDSCEANFLTAVEPDLDIKLLITQVAVDRFLIDDDGLVANSGTSNFYRGGPAGSRSLIAFSQ